jgi:hypothetical protein
MAFFKRIMDHLLNQVMVETLANSRWFQRFAVYTHRLSKEAAEKGACGVLYVCAVCAVCMCVSADSGSGIA